MVVKQYPVNKCSDCPRYLHDFRAGESYCNEAGRSIRRELYDIPDWCPLDDYVTKACQCEGICDADKG